MDEIETLRSEGSEASQPLVSFVVLCYRTEPYVGECIASIFAQRAAYDWEIVAIDDCSPDGTAEVLKSFRDKRMRVIVNEKNMGHAAALTRALSAARGKFIARIDSDDRYRPEFLETVIPILNRHPNVGFVYGDAALISSTSVETAPQSDWRHGGRDFNGNELVAVLEENIVCAPTVCARREAWLRHLPIPGHLAFSDWYFSVLIAREFDFYFVNRVIADYRVHAGNMHARTILDRTEEKSIFWMLDYVYAEPERDLQLECAKRKARKRVYGNHWLTLASKYFGAGMNSDARRCYWRALCHRPRKILDLVFMRRFAATILGRGLYERGKRIYRATQGA